MNRICRVCSAEFKARANYKCCSAECSKQNQTNRMKAWNQAHPDRIKQIKARYERSLHVMICPEHAPGTLSQFMQRNKLSKASVERTAADGVSVIYRVGDYNLGKAHPCR